MTHTCAGCGEPAGDVCLWCWRWHCAACLAAPELCPDCEADGLPAREFRPGVAVVDVDTGGRL